jgi:hypothetical protein
MGQKRLLMYCYMTFRNIEKYQDWLEDVFKADDALEKSLSVDSAVSHLFTSLTVRP